MTDKRYYVVGVKDPAVWDRVHEALIQDGTLLDNIPAEPIQCVDLKEHSPTRAVYLMTDAEAEEVRKCSEVKFVDLDQSRYPEQFPPPTDELHCMPTRWNTPVKNYKEISSLPTSPTLADANRSGYQLLRCAQYENPWQGQPSTTVIESTIRTTTTGRDIDLIVGDDGCWFGHQEFQSVITGGAELPNDYVGGNKLPGGGTCDLLDVVLEGPYYIDPDWFNASPGTRLETRWDGTIVPVESVAKEWWGNASARSSQFSTAGTVIINSGYTRANCNGSNSAKSAEGDHGTACSGQAYGRTQGWAYNANKWVINAYGTYGLFPFDNYFDVVKIFHLNKPINPLYGTRDPTVSSNSWGFRATVPTTGFYWFRAGTSGTGGIAYTGTKPEFMRYIGIYGDGGRCKGEMVDNNLTTAGDELIASGVIFVAAAGNSNQKQVSSSSPDFNNYWATANNTPLINATHLEFGATCYNTTNRRGFPQQLGKYTQDGQVVYPVINIGALDDQNQPDGKERKVNYSDMGNEIDCYTPGDKTLVSNRSYSPQYIRYGSYANTVTTASGFTAVCSSSAVLTGTGTINTSINTGSRITTGIGTANITSIASSLNGPFGSTSNSPTFGGNDDGYWQLALPFPITFNGVTYNEIFVGTNSYITFGTGSNQYASLGPSTPALPKIMICAADNSCQTIYYGVISDFSPLTPDRFRVRWEGTDNVSGVAGSPNMVWEATFYEGIPDQIDIQIGVNARAGGQPISFYDCLFGGTSSACPTAAGLIAIKLENNRNWGWQQIRTWLRSLREQPSANFYQGPDPSTANSADWADVVSLMGSTRTVLYQEDLQSVRFSGAGLSMTGAGLSVRVT